MTVDSITWTQRAAKALMERGTENARALMHEYVASEHVLLALTEEITPLLKKIFADAGAIVAELREQVWRMTMRGPDFTYPLGLLPATPPLEMAMTHAEAYATEMGMDEINTGHLVLGLLREQRCLAAQIFMDQGLRLERAIEIVRKFGHVDEDEE